MAAHEMGYLLISGALQCFFWGPENHCPHGEKINPGGISREQVPLYETKEVHYEEKGFAVFSYQDDRIEIRKKTGEKAFLRLSELNRQTPKNLPPTIFHDQAQQSLWRFESLEDIFKRALIGKETETLPLLRKNDLKSNLKISNDELEEVRKTRLRLFLEENKRELPVGYFVVKTACTYEKVQDSMMGTCAPPPKAPVYARPDRSSEKILDASLTWAHILGNLRLTPAMINAPHREEELIVFEEKGDWVRLELVVLDEKKRKVWAHKKDLSFPIFRLEERNRGPYLLDFLSSPGTPPAFNQPTLEEFKSLLQKPVDLDLDFAGETRWHEGILWIKVRVKSSRHCSTDEDGTLATGWLPYIEPKTKKKVLKWFSRGC